MALVDSGSGGVDEPSLAVAGGSSLSGATGEAELLVSTTGVSEPYPAVVEAADGSMRRTAGLRLGRGGLHGLVLARPATDAHETDARSVTDTSAGLGGASGLGGGLPPAVGEVAGTPERCLSSVCGARRSAAG